MMLEIERRGEKIAWSASWVLESLGAHRLVAVPRLRLSQEAAMELVARIPYASVFGEATTAVDTERRPFIVLHAAFDLYRTGEPDIVGFAVLVPEPGEPLPPASVAITRTAQMLRGDDR